MTIYTREIQHATESANEVAIQGYKHEGGDNLNQLHIQSYNNLLHQLTKSIAE